MNKKNKNKSRRDKANEVLDVIFDYLSDAGWGMDYDTCFRIDPISKAKYPSDTAFSIQIGRDLTLDYNKK